MTQTEEQILEDIPQETIKEQRSCTRCDGSQHLIAEYAGMGKYVCDICTMSVGFDLHADPSEFLINRGLPSRYTKNVFGNRLMNNEIRTNESS